MQYGFVLPTGDARTAAEAASVAERAGWDGFFVWEPVWGDDAWVSLAAAAMSTERIRLGTMLTPISRMRPWKLASETVSLDRLSGGRLILGAGLGAPDSGFGAFGEETDRRIRAELLDEGLAILTGLWGGLPFRFSGKHYTVDATDLRIVAPPPVQRPRIPIWMVGAHGSARSMRRAAACDGLLPNVIGPEGVRGPQLDELPAIVAAVHALRPAAAGPFDIIFEGASHTDSRDAAAAKTRAAAAAGATWWIDGMWDAPAGEEGRAAIMHHLARGAPR